MPDFKEINEKIKSTDAVIIGASNGLSITEGLHIFANNADFHKLFGDFQNKYGISCILQGFFAQWPSEEERWAFLSRLINHYSVGYTGSPVMDTLKQIIGDKPYFIVTSNGENHFELAGFNPDAILEIEGSWKGIECSRGCCNEILPVWDMVKEMAACENNGKIPSHLVPHCPHCGAPMQIHMRPYGDTLNAYRRFISEYHNKRIVILELGIGSGNRLIKQPLMQLAFDEPHSTYITVNKGDLYIPSEIANKSYGLDGLLADILPQLI